MKTWSSKADVEGSTRYCIVGLRLKEQQPLGQTSWNCLIKLSAHLQHKQSFHPLGHQMCKQTRQEGWKWQPPCQIPGTTTRVEQVSSLQLWRMHIWGHLRFGDLVGCSDQRMKAILGPVISTNQIRGKDIKCSVGGMVTFSFYIQ